MAKTVASQYVVAFPILTPNQVNFTFGTFVNGSNFQFNFQFYNNHWYAWATLPSGEIRQLGVHNGCLSWTGFLDYGIYITTSGSDSIGQTDIYSGLVSMYLLFWG